MLERREGSGHSFKSFSCAFDEASYLMWENDELIAPKTRPEHSKSMFTSRKINPTPNKTNVVAIEVIMISITNIVLNLQAVFGRVKKESLPQQQKKRKKGSGLKTIPA